MSGQLPAKSSCAPCSRRFTAAVRQRLQQVFEHAQRCAEKGDRDYAQRSVHAVRGRGPGNLIYLQHFLANLAQKYGNNKTGAGFAGLKIKSVADDAQQGGRARANGARRSRPRATRCKVNPWDTATLLALADACRADRQRRMSRSLSCGGRSTSTEGPGRESPGRDRRCADGAVRQGDRLLAARGAGEAAR